MSSEPLNHIDLAQPGYSYTDVNTPGSSPDSNAPPNDPIATNVPPSKRSDVLRHVFPLPHNAWPIQNPPVRVTKTEYRKSSLTANKNSRQRVAFHRVLASFLPNSSARVMPRIIYSSATSKFLSSRSRARSSSVHGSTPSLDFVSPGAFIFSGRNPRSHSGPSSHSTSQLSNLVVNSSDPHSLRRVHSDTFSIDDISVLEDGIFESYLGQGIGTPIEEMETCFLENVKEDVQSLSENARLQMQGRQSYLDAAFATLLLPYLSFASRNALRATCKAWHVGIDCIAPPKFPASYRIPNELLQQIYKYLSPKDFNAARHTCRFWMRASLDKRILTAMLQRGGWWSSVESDLKAEYHNTDENTSTLALREAWFLSRRLSRECALSTDWTGTGLSYSKGLKAIMEVSDTDFTEFANGYSHSGGPQSVGLIFTTSTCGHFLLVARETLIYIYEIQGGNMVPMTSVVCPRRVLSMSMDVSSGRNAVAALLEGRMGLVCDLRYSHKGILESQAEIYTKSNGHHYQTVTRAPISISRGAEFGAEVDAADCMPLSLHLGQYHTKNRDQIPFDSIDVQSSYEAITLQEVSDRRSYIQNHINQTWNLNLKGSHSNTQSRFAPRHTGACSHVVPLSSGISTLYRHLCSEDDPPRCVSICPQRRCVAFGCSAGIELHWIDALTGQSLSRWFPLTAPSDYLYFLAPRPNFESAKKLRLISSAAHPDDQPAICRKVFFSHPAISSFWGSFGFHDNLHRSNSPSYDHYHAFPLSDGYHILFIDPQIEKLFMGCDAPLGGPTKLLRKIMFVPPSSCNQAPRLYSSAFDMSEGARIVVAFGDTIVLYSIPPDVCNLSRIEQEAGSWGASTAPPLPSEGCSADHWLNWWDETYISDCGVTDSIWPIAIRGMEIGIMRSVSELAIHTKPDITIWGFSLDLQCKTWQLRNHADSLTRSRRYICRSGIVHEAYMVDEVRDVIMTDMSAPSSPLLDEFGPEHSIGFDGNSSQTLLREEASSGRLINRIPKALHVENDKWIDLLDVRGCDAWYNSKGDLVTVPWSEDFAEVEWETEIEDGTTMEDGGAFMED